MATTHKPDYDDPVEYFLEEQDYLGNSSKTKQNYELVLSGFREYLQDPERNPKGVQIDIEEADRRDCLSWIQTYRDADFDYSDSTISSYASNLHSFFKYMNQIGAFDANPMTNVLQKIDESTETNPQRREISISEMANFVGQIHSPQTKAIVVTLLKTGMRHGELINLDVRDIHIDDASVKNEYPGVRHEIEDRPDSIFVPSDIEVGDVYNGEERRFSNKRKRDTIVPIDDELKLVLSRWLAARPDSSEEANPLFTATLHNWGERLSRSSVKELVRTEVEPYGWYSEDADLSTNVTPHYFRHYFTTHMRQLSGDDAMVKYIRGDVGDDILDTYTHHWGDKVREQYELSIYKLL